MRIYDSIHERRQKKIISQIPKNVDLLFITRPENIYYLTNYQTAGNPIQVLLISKNGLVHLITRELESTNAKYRSYVSYSYYNEIEDSYQNIVNYINKKNINKTIKVIGFEHEQISHEHFTEFQNRLKDNYEIADISNYVSQFRGIKTSEEIAYIKKAANMVHKGIETAINNMKVGMMETEIGGIITKKMTELGSEYTSYPCFVAGAERGCMGHYTGDQHKLHDGDLLFMEIGACYKRYHAARMHTMYLGNDEPGFFVLGRKLIKEGIREGMKMMRPGVKACDVDKIMRDIIAGFSVMGMKYKQSDRSGYSIGIGFYTDWSELEVINMNPGSEDILCENMVIHLIPWIQIPGKGAIGFSETVLVTADGGVPLSPANSEVYPRAYHYINRSVSIGGGERHNDNNLLNFVRNTHNDVIDFHKDTPRTPLLHKNVLLRNDNLDEGIHPNIYIKDESSRLGQISFKIIGASYAVHKLRESGLITGDTITTMTDGNHGTAIAYLAQKYGYKCVIYIPNNLLEKRVKLIESFGAQCVRINGNYDDAIEIVKNDAKTNNWTLISDTSWDGYELIPKYIISGYYKIFEEVRQQMMEMGTNRITHIFLQVGVGGFASAGIAHTLLELDDDVKIICVEPEDADCLMENMKQPDAGGVLMSKGGIDSIMTGLNCGALSKIGWLMLRDNVSTYMSIGDGHAYEAMMDMRDEGINVGECGGAGLAALRICMKDEKICEHLDLSDESNVLIINTEGKL
jgi:diaminopropionate ammonia-lyase family